MSFCKIHISKKEVLEVDFNRGHLLNFYEEIEEQRQVIKDIKDFYRPTKDIIYSGDAIIDIAEQNLEVLKEM